MGADIRQRYDDLDTNTTSVLRNIDLAAGSPAISGDIVMFSGICSSAGTEIALATSTLQTTGNAILTTMDADTGAIATSVASIDSKTPSLGQALAAASVPVVLTAAQLSTLTPPAAITGFALLTEQQTQTGHLVTLIGHVDGVEGSLTNAVTALQIMDDWDETNRCAVNLIVGQAGITAAAGAVAANTPRVTLGSDDPAVVSLQLIDDSIYTVGSVPSVTKGVMIVGKFSSDGSIQPLSVTDEGKAEVAAHLYAGGGPVPTGNGAAGGVAQRVTIANDSTGNIATIGTSVTPGTSAAHLGKAEDAAHSNGDTGVMALTVRKDTAAATSGADGDYQPAITDAQGRTYVADDARTTGGESSYSFLSTAAVQAAEIKSSAGTVYNIEFFNKNAAAMYVRLYNQTGTPGTGDAANILWRGMIPGNTAGGGFVKTWPKGKAFSTGIGIRVSAAIADNDATVLGANEVFGNVGYK